MINILKYRYLERFSGGIRPFQSKCKDFEWRESLNVTDVVDVCDTCKVWYNCTVLDVRLNFDENKEVLIGITLFYTFLIISINKI